MTTLENWTPHELRLIREDGTELILAPAGPAPRLQPARRPLGMINGLRVVQTVLGPPQGVPEQRAGVVLVVSALVAEHPALANRTDLAYPGEAIRDDSGRVIGAKGLCAGPGMAGGPSFHNIDIPRSVPIGRTE